MAIGQIITIDTKDKSIVGTVGGKIMMKGEKGDLTSIWQSIVPNLKEFPDIVPSELKNYLVYSKQSVLGGDVINMFGLNVSSIKRDENNILYGHLDLGHFHAAILFLETARKLSSGGEEYPLWQENELSGYMPLTDNLGNSRLEEVCFGKAQWIQIEKRDSFEYVRRDNLICDYAASRIVGINRELFRKLSFPIISSLKELCLEENRECCAHGDNK